MPSNNIYQEEKVPGQLKRFVQNYRKHTLAKFGFWCLLLLLICMFFAPWISPYDALQKSEFILMPPSWDPNGSVNFFLGTDDQGRDMLSRLLFGSRLTLGYGLLISLLACLFGCLIGLAAGVTKGMLSRILHHAFDAIMAIPSLLLAVVFILFMGVGEIQILLAILLSLLPRFIRPIYQAVTYEMKQDYNIAMRLDGANKWQILRFSVLPKLYIIIAAEFTMATTIAILDITAFGFLKLGAQPPSPEWGAMMGASLDIFYNAPWTITLPGLFIVFSIISINLVGEGVHKSLSLRVD